MPDIDPSQILTAAQEEAKNANENFRLYILSENERLHDENAELSNLRVQKGKQEVKIRFYRGTKWWRDGAIVMLTFLGLIPTFFSGGLPASVRLLCFGLVCITTTVYFCGWWFGRIDADDV